MSLSSSFDSLPKEQDIEVVNVQQRAKLLEFAERLAQLALCWAERLAIGALKETSTA